MPGGLRNRLEARHPTRQIPDLRPPGTEPQPTPATRPTRTPARDPPQRGASGRLVVAVADRQWPELVPDADALPNNHRVGDNLRAFDPPVIVEVPERHQPVIKQPPVQAFMWEHDPGREKVPGQPPNVFTSREIVRGDLPLEPYILGDRLGNDPKPADDLPRAGHLAHHGQPRLQVVPGHPGCPRAISPAVRPPAGCHSCPAAPG